MRAVFRDRAAQPPAWLLLLELRLAGLKVIARIERLIAMEVIASAMQIVRARSRDRVEDDAGGVAELRLILAGNDLELLDRVGRRVRSDRVDRHELVADAVDQDLAAAA